MSAANVVQLAPAGVSISKPRDLLGSQVAVDLAESEERLDQLLAALGKGLSTMAGQRRQAGLRAGFCQAPLQQYVDVISQGVAMRGAIAQVHKGFAREARREGIDWTLMMPTESTPTEPEQDGPPRGG